MRFATEIRFQAGQCDSLLAPVPTIQISEADVAIGDHGHAADHGIINAATRQVGQQPFEQGNNLLRG